MRILIAEDDETCALVLASMFKPYGPSVMVADGEAVIRVVTTELVKQQPFDLVCLDIMMPGLDGQACLRCIRAIEQGFGRVGGAGTKILMTTALDAPDSPAGAWRISQFHPRMAERGRQLAAYFLTCRHLGTCRIGSRVLDRNKIPGDVRAGEFRAGRGIVAIANAVHGKKRA